MPNHPNRGPKGPSANPLPEQVRAARDACGLSQAAAAALIHCPLRWWREWEVGNRKMHPAFLSCSASKARHNVESSGG